MTTNDPSNRDLSKRLLRRLLETTPLLLLWCALLFYYFAGANWWPSWPSRIENPNPERRVIDPEAPPFPVLVDGVDWRSGLKIGAHWQTVRATCTACHSAKLITQNRATRQGWEDMLRWMQAEQGLPDLGEREGPILDYLSTYYAPETIGRRRVLAVEQWYELPE